MKTHPDVLAEQAAERDRETCPIFGARVQEMVAEVQRRRAGSFKLGPDAVRSLAQAGIQDGHLAMAMGGYGDITRQQIQSVRRLLGAA